MSPLEAARAFMAATQTKDAAAAVAVCTEGVELLLPGADAPLRGKEGIRQMIRMSPQFTFTLRKEEEHADDVRITTLTRAPGLFANYTTWRFEIEGGMVHRLRFELRGAN